MTQIKTSGPGPLDWIADKVKGLFARKSWMPFGTYSDKTHGMGAPVWLSTSKTDLLVKGFMYNPTVYMIVSYITRLASQIPWVLYEIKDEKSFSRYKNFDPTDMIRSKLMEHKALERITGGHKILEIWKRPNGLQGQAEFVEQLLGYKLTTGDTYIHGTGPTSGPNAGQFHELDILPAQLIGIQYGSPQNPLAHYYWIGDPSKHIDPDVIMHSKYWSPLPLSQGGLLGLSPIMAASRLVTRNNDSITASVRALQNMGAMGILSKSSSAGDKGMTEDQAKQVEATYMKKYGGADNRGKIMVTGAAVKWQQMGQSPADLKIIQQEMMDLRLMCGVYGLQSQLFNDPDNKTYSNMREAVVAAYTQAVIPQLRSIRDELNRWWIPAFAEADNKRYWFDLDLQAIPELQKNIKELMEWLEKADMLTPNEKRLVIDYEVLTSTGMDEVWVDQSKLPMTQAVIDISSLDK